MISCKNINKFHPHLGGTPLRPGTFAFALPIIAMSCVAALMLSLGALFTVAGTQGTIILGLAIIILIQLCGFIIAKRFADR